jgi:hypothetical protein
MMSIVLDTLFPPQSRRSVQCRQTALISRDDVLGRAASTMSTCFDGDEHSVLSDAILKRQKRRW